MTKGPQRTQSTSTDFPLEAAALAELRALANSPGFIYALASAAASTAFTTREAAQDPYSRLTVNELSLTTGLMASQQVTIASLPPEDILSNQIEQLYELHEKLRAIVGESSSKELQSIAGALPGHNQVRTDSPPRPTAKALRESIFYEGTGAYDFQYLDLAASKYRNDSEWLEANTGLSIDLLVRVAKELQYWQELRIVPASYATSHENRLRRVLAAFSFNRADLHYLSDDQFVAFIQRFAVTPGEDPDAIDSVSAENKADFCPILRLGEDHYFLPVGFRLAQAIYEGPIHWMREDQAYGPSAGDHRGMATEEIAAQLLKPVFGKNLYRNVLIKENGEDFTDIDLLGIAGNRALIVQAKSKGLTALARQGDEEKFQDDFYKAVQHAYNQGLESRVALFDPQRYTMSVDGKPFVLPESVDEAYILCLTLDHFPVLPFVTSWSLERKADEPHTVAASVFELDRLVTYLSDPLELLHYFDRRVRGAGNIQGMSEMSFLAQYLQQGLPLPGATSIFHYTDRLGLTVELDFREIRGRNRHLQHLQGNPPQQAGSNRLQNRWRTNGLQEVVGLCKNTPGPVTIDALFMLYDIPEGDVPEILRGIQKARKNCERTSGTTDWALELSGNKGISYVCVPEDYPDLEGPLENHAELRRYYCKATKWLGLVGTPTLPFAAGSFNSEPWEFDAGLENSARSTFHSETARQKLNRNQPCWCGSGLKYKRCHAR